MEVILIDYRWVFVCFFLLPISFVYNLFYYVRNVIVFRLNTAPKKHDSKVKKIQSQVKNWRNSGMKTKMCTARPGWQTMSFRRPLYKRHFTQIDCNLIDILEVDLNRGVIRVEPLVNMGQISATLAKLGWTIAIVPELDDLTVGGLVMGTGIESSSHIYGLFQHICESYELVLADGSLITCSKHENSDLFYAVPWSYGTLGFLTAVEIKIIPATKYIRLKYEPVRGLTNLCRKFDEASRNQRNCFVEALQFSLEEAVIMTGVKVSDNEVDSEKINEIGKWYKPWFFVHVRNMIRSNREAVEYIPLKDYFHRHSRSIFWELQDIVPFGNNILFRYLFGWLMPVKVSLLKITQTAAIKKLYEENHIIQDMLVPISKMEKCLREIDDAVQVYPIWLCPFNLPNDPGMVHPKTDTAQMYVDIGIYGVPQRKFDAKPVTRRIESLVGDCDGFQMLYADTYRTEAEFRQMFDHSLYDKMRNKYDCKSAFPEVFGKVNKNVRD